jgi:hypothetical protein
VEIIWRKRGEMVPSGDFMEISVPRYGGKQARWRKHGDFCDYVKQTKIMSKVCLWMTVNDERRRNEEPYLP